MVKIQTTMKKLLLSLSFTLFYTWNLVAQLDPALNTLPYVQDFGTNDFFALPSGMKIWRSIGVYSDLATAEASAPSSWWTTVTSGDPFNPSTIGVHGHAVNGDARLSIKESATSSPQLALGLNTMNILSIDIDYDLIQSIPNSRSIGIALQYRVGTTGSFTTIPGSAVSYKNGTSNGGDIDTNSDLDHYSLSLPPATYNQPVVQLRWITWRGSELGNSSCIGIDNIHIGCSPSGIIYVDSSATSSGDGQSWATAFQTLSQALSAARYCSEINTINVAAGTYKPTVKPYSVTTGYNIAGSDPRDFTFQMRGGLSLYGGFPAGGGVRDIVANPTILSGDIGVINDSTDNVYHVMVLPFQDSASTFLIDGFTICKGRSTGSGDINLLGGTSSPVIYRDRGAAMFIQNGTHTITNNIFLRHTGRSAIYADNSITTITNNIITQNSSTGIFLSMGATVMTNSTITNNKSSGAAIYTTTATITNNTITGNTSTGSVGGIGIGGTGTFTDNTITGNTASLDAGGVYISGAITGTNNTITNNTSGRRGGGIFNYYCNSSITNNTITGNVAVYGGGGIYADTGSPTIDGNILSNNIGGGRGGGVCLQSTSGVLSNNTITESSADNGGGIYNDSYDTEVISNIVTNNTANNIGGGICNVTAIESPLINNVISGNTASVQGGGIYIEQGYNNIINNLIAKNVASKGGGIYSVNGRNHFINNTIADNIASNLGGGIHTFEADDTLTNNIFWGNHDGDASTLIGDEYYSGYYFSSSSSYNIFKNNLLQSASSNYTFSNVGHYAISTVATGNIFGVNPLFTDSTDIDGADNIYNTLDDGFRLQTGSVAINAGAISISSPLADIIGNVRSLVPFDLGAYEYGEICNAGQILYVDASASANGNGTSWATAIQTLPAALNKAWNCPNVTTINVAAGTYKPSLKPFNNDGTNITTTDARDVTFHIRKGLSLYGGFPAGGGVRNVAANPTILSGDIGIVNDNIDNAYHVVLTSLPNPLSTTLLDGFTVSQGNANGIDNISLNGQIIGRSEGGGICIRNGLNSLSNNTLTDNSADYGAGIYINDGRTALSNTIFTGNTAANRGGGVYTYLGATTLSNSVLSNNTANYGAGVYTYNGTNTLMNNTLLSNIALIKGGGVYTLSGLNMLSNNILWENQNLGVSTIQGADYYADGTNGNTFINNLFQLASNNYPLSNTGNYAIGTAASGNVFAVDPLFINAADIDGTDNMYRTADDGLYFTCGSPAYNTGINTNTPTLDILGNSIFATTKDMGAYESQIDISTPTINIVGATTNIDSVNLIATGGGTYTWSDGNTPNMANNTFITSGTYTVTVTGAGNCTATASVTVTVLPNGSFSPQPFDNLNLYFVPNPTPQGNGQLMIESDVEGEAYLQVFDMYGRLIGAQKINLLQGVMRLPYQLNLATSNMLFFHLTTTAGTIVHKVIVGL